MLPSTLPLQHPTGLTDIACGLVEGERGEIGAVALFSDLQSLQLQNQPEVPWV